MLSLDVTDEAEEDLLGIWLYIAEDEPIKADRFLDKLDKTIYRLTDFPDMGRERPELMEGYKCFPVGNYMLYYLHDDEVLHLARVMRCSLDTDET